MSSDTKHILAHFKSESGDFIGTPLDLPVNITVKKLQLICNALLEKQEIVPYTFFVNEIEVTDNLEKVISHHETEKILEIIYQPQAVFRVRAVTRCSSTIEGHAEAVISVAFSPDGRYLASGSGDTTVRFWDVNTETPHLTCRGHTHWILCIAWSPDGQKLASACKNGQICLWNPNTGQPIGKTMCGHRQWITYLVWEPFHLNAECRRLASASKDTTIKIWDVVFCQVLLTLSAHTQSVTSLRWGGSGLIYSSSQDRTIKVWRAEDGVLCRTLEGHGHWVNTLALSTDYVIRTGAFNPADASYALHETIESNEELSQKALKRYKEILGPERLVSGSDDFTMFLWHPETQKKFLTRMTGHQQLINEVKFSPDARLIASASFDKSVKIWNGLSGKFITSLRGHVQPVYQIAWAADSRLLISSSADSTIKLWDLTTKKLLFDLPGHSDEVYAVDWSPDSQKVASGGKDKVLKIWRN